MNLRLNYKQTKELIEELKKGNCYYHISSRGNYFIELSPDKTRIDWIREGTGANCYSNIRLNRKALHELETESTTLSSKILEAYQNNIKTFG